MDSISDLIEKFILEALGEDNELEISRNELANFFSCAPSQINYVLETRFTLDRGFVKNSKRGGGGSIRLSRINFGGEDDVTQMVLKNIGDNIAEKRAEQILENLFAEKVITEREKKIISSVLKGSAISTPLAIKDYVRANLLKSVLLVLLEDKEG